MHSKQFGCFFLDPLTYLKLHVFPAKNKRSNLGVLPIEVLMS